MRFTTLLLLCLALLSAVFGQDIAKAEKAVILTDEISPTKESNVANESSDDKSVAATTRILSERNAAYNEDEQLAAAAAQTYTMEFRPRQRRSRKSNQRLVPHYARRQYWVNKVTPWIAPAVSAGLGAYKLYSAVKKRRLTEMKARQTHDDQQPSTDEEQPVMRPRRGISARWQNWLSKAAPYV
ncbi:unnamed protein product, partial [Aphanomyces euteiches]